MTWAATGAAAGGATGAAAALDALVPALEVMVAYCLSGLLSQCCTGISIEKYWLQY